MSFMNCNLMLKQIAVDAEYETYKVSNTTLNRNGTPKQSGNPTTLNTVPQSRAETLRH